MIGRKRMYSISSVLICLGACLLASVAGVFVYGRFEAWLQAQPRALVSTRVLWPEVPPMTPLPSSTPVPSPTPGPPARIEIPKLRIARAVVPLGTVTRDGQLEWDVEKLFATSNRRDLVGHLEGTANPGQPGNVVLAGHNYNRGFFNWTGVFYALDRLRKGDTVHLYNDQDKLFTYLVEQVEMVPWREYLTVHTPTHIAYLLPTQDETLTLVTCGGANFAPFPSRIYVTAKRVLEEIE